MENEVNTRSGYREMHKALSDFSTRAALILDDDEKMQPQFAKLLLKDLAVFGKKNGLIKKGFEPEINSEDQKVISLLDSYVDLLQNCGLNNEMIVENLLSIFSKEELCGYGYDDIVQPYFESHPYVLRVAINRETGETYLLDDAEAPQDKLPRLIDYYVDVAQGHMEKAYIIESLLNIFSKEELENYTRNRYAAKYLRDFFNNREASERKGSILPTMLLIGGAAAIISVLRKK